MLAGKQHTDEKLLQLQECQEEMQTLLTKLIREIKDSKKTIRTLEQRLRRRDELPKRAAGMRRAAGEKPLWVIKCPAPSDARRANWGDYPFALSLQKELRRRGIYAVIDLYEDWNYEEVADVVIALRGKYPYLPDRRNTSCVYLLWNISHPDTVTDEEYASYDIVCVASKRYATALRERLTVPVYPLLQCTDTELFYPDDTVRQDMDYLFVGNTRKVVREGVVWAAEEGKDLTIYGKGWDKLLPDSKRFVRAEAIAGDKLPELYRRARVTLNDHWADMRDNGFVNNRVFDALASGLPVLSDANPELMELFPTEVLTYTDKDGFLASVRRLEADYEEIRKGVLALRKRICEEFSFKARARELTEIINNYEH